MSRLSRSAPIGGDLVRGASDTIVKLGVWVAPRWVSPDRLSPWGSSTTAMRRPFFLAGICRAGFCRAGFFPSRNRPSGFRPESSSPRVARSAEIQRNRHLLGAMWPDFAIRGPFADCVESSGNPEKSPRFADPPPGRFCGEEARIRDIPTRSAAIRRYRHLLGRPGAMSLLMDQRSIV